MYDPPQFRPVLPGYAEPYSAVFPFLSGKLASSTFSSGPTYLRLCLDWYLQGCPLHFPLLTAVSGVISPQRVLHTAPPPRAIPTHSLTKLPQTPGPFYLQLLFYIQLPFYLCPGYLWAYIISCARFWAEPVTNLTLHLPNHLYLTPGEVKIIND